MSYWKCKNCGESCCVSEEIIALQAEFRQKLQDRDAQCLKLHNKNLDLQAEFDRYKNDTDRSLNLMAITIENLEARVARYRKDGDE